MKSIAFCDLVIGLDFMRAHWQQAAW